MNSRPMIEARDVAFRAGPREQPVPILHGVSLSVQEGEFLALTGASGSGKSTLLHLVGLLDQPSDGEIAIQGRVTRQFSDAELASFRGRTIGFVFQSFHLIPYLTALENVMLPLEYARRPQAPAQAAALLDRLGLSHRQDAYPTTLSGGERQRVALARALVNKPVLLLADEPTGSLDSESGRQVLGLLEEQHRRGTTVILVTHDEAIAARAGRRVRMKDGRIV